MLLVYIHGASATSESFNYIRKHIKGKELLINYDSRNGFEKNLENMKELLSAQQNMFFICHSLGGIYALHLTANFPNQVLGAITLSTPYGGAEVADVAKYFLPYSRLLKDIGPNSWAMKQVSEMKINCPWTNVVTTQGSAPWIPSPNDGVVTIKSQQTRDDIMDLVQFDCNHYEIVLNYEVVKLVRSKIKKILG
jgi:triacylglycerol esterase/lipase EstA (alpha/beta hydrolase family)